MNHLKEEEREESGILTDSTENKATEQEIQKEEQKEWREKNGKEEKWRK